MGPPSPGYQGNYYLGVTFCSSVFCFSNMDNTVLILGDSHLKRMGENFRFPDWFDVVGISGGKVQIWENFKDENRSNHILVIVAGGNNVTARPWDPLQS